MCEPPRHVASSTDGRFIDSSAPVDASGSGVRDPSVATGHPLALYYAYAMAHAQLPLALVGARSAPYCFGVKIARSLRAPSSGFSEPIHHASRISASSSLEVICVAAESAGSRSDRIE